MNNETKTGMSFGLGGFIVGALLGGILGVLYAPRSGDQTRKIVRKNVVELVSSAQNTFSDTQKAISQKASEISTSVKDLTKKDNKDKEIEQLKKQVEMLEKETGKKKSK